MRTFKTVKPKNPKDKRIKYKELACWIDKYHKKLRFSKIENEKHFFGTFKLNPLELIANTDYFELVCTGNKRTLYIGSSKEDSGCNSGELKFIEDNFSEEIKNSL